MLAQVIAALCSTISSYCALYDDGSRGHIVLFGRPIVTPPRVRASPQKGSGLHIGEFDKSN